MPYRLIHVLLASGLTICFLMLGLASIRHLKGDRKKSVVKILKTGLVGAAVLIPLQILAGDMHDLNSLENQPAKVAAMESNWETSTNVPLILFALPDEETRTNRFEISIPGLASFILTHDFDGEVPGLNDFVTEEGEVLHPPVAPLFWAFRIMVGIGLLMLATSWAASFMWYR